MSPAEYNSKLEAQLENMKSKDASSKSLSKAVSSYFHEEDEFEPCDVMACFPFSEKGWSGID